MLENGIKDGTSPGRRWVKGSTIYPNDKIPTRMGVNVVFILGALNKDTFPVIAYKTLYFKYL